jgi:putative protein-disulfide isomerase
MIVVRWRDLRVLRFPPAMCAQYSGGDDTSKVLRFQRICGRAAPVKVTTLFDLSPREYEAIVAGLADENLVRRVSVGNGYFLEPAAGASCDVERGTCAL